MPGFGIAEAAGVGLDGMERPSEDVVIVLPDAVILLDGATSSRGDLPSGGDYARELGAQLAARLSAAPELDLAKLVAGSIRSVVRHNGFTPGDSPSSTVSIVRWNDTAVEALVLADSPVAAFLTDAVEVVADDRLRALRKSVDTVVEWRNREGGFWVAEALPAAADQAMRASWPRADVRSVLMATDGVSCGIDDFGVFGGWEDMRRMAETDGPQAVLDAVRAAELTDPDMARWPRTKLHDDQALVHLDFAGEANGTLRSG